MAKVALLFALCFVVIAGCFAGVSPKDMMDKAVVDASSKIVSAEMMTIFNKIIKLFEDAGTSLALAVADQDIQKCIGDMSKAAAELKAICMELAQQFMAKFM